MPRLEDRPHLYGVADRFINAALKNDDSMFTPGKAVWAPDPIHELHRRYVLNEDLSARPFDVKLREQLDDASDATIQLAAEIFYMTVIVPYDMSGQAKRNFVDAALSAMTNPVTIPPDLDRLLDERGMARVGTGHMHRYYQTVFLIELVRNWKSVGEDKQARLLADPWQFKEFVAEVKTPKAQVLRNGILHLIFPETFEPITSSHHKQLIANQYVYVGNGETSTDIDRRLLAAREGFDESEQSEWRYYDPLVRPGWDPNASKWDKFVYWAAKFHSLPNFDEYEREPKLEVARNVAAARDALKSGSPDWFDKLKRSFGSPNYLTHFMTVTKFQNWCRENPDIAANALTCIWNVDETPEQRMRAFLALVPNDHVGGPSARIGLATYLMRADDPTGIAFYRSTPFFDCYRLTEWPIPPKDADEADQYVHAQDFLTNMINEAAARGLALRDHLDAQSIVWTLTRWDPEDPWSEADQVAFKAYLKGEHVDGGESNGAPEPPGPQGGTPPVEMPPAELTLESLAKELLLPIDHLRKVARLLEHKKQAIFYGPPGTGKTYVARELAKYFARNGDTVDIVQFHPSYAYEDFVEGFRPQEVDGQAVFRLVPGPLKRIAEQAREQPETTHVLLIDEINRGNLSKVLGELYFLLEYRDEAITLQYSDDEFALPENLWIIGTMNTADRSIALVDAALRRRFFFVGFFPDEEPIDGLLRRWLARNNPDYLWVADIVDEANRRLDDRHLAIGPSYFMKDNLDEEWLEIIWEHQVIPYLAEQFFGEEARLDEFHLKNLRRQQVTELPEETDKAGE